MKRKIDIDIMNNVSEECGDTADVFGRIRNGDVSASWDPSVTLKHHKQMTLSSGPSNPLVDNLHPSAKPAHRTSLPPIKTSYNQRAKEGFRFWLIEKPIPTNFGKYGIGSYKTVLGIGNAPRT
ncbi:uncharacterized protein LOC126826897 isoform X2 [Patella vulgata]|uniref:uncharacterized protein LOC126826897 isoform X2 n=1 Tax=Patella vulgata TaxID=6465 RepID=UPI0024A9B93B|nr:uncharacterized protein LOC126826897 isoform X2 [Patella vulgata]